MDFLFFIISYTLFSYIAQKIFKIFIKDKNIINLNIKFKKITKEIIQFIICVGTVILFVNLFENNIIIVGILSAIINGFFLQILD
jgi:hypothetical protein